MSLAKTIDVEFEITFKNSKEEITVLASCWDIIAKEAIGLQLQFFDKNMDNIDYRYSEKFLNSVAEMALPRLLDQKLEEMEEGIDKFYNHDVGGEG